MPGRELLEARETNQLDKVKHPDSRPARDLLLIFHLSPRESEARYLDLYHKLVRYFAWNRKVDAEDLAQETLKRTLVKLQQGTKITTDNPEAYFFGVARNLLRESRVARREEQLRDSLPELHQAAATYPEIQEQSILLKECLRELPKHDVEMLAAYISGRGQAWAQERGIHPASLRSRIHRLRRRLERLTVSKPL